MEQNRVQEMLGDLRLWGFSREKIAAEICVAAETIDRWRKGATPRRPCAALLERMYARERSRRQISDND